jgi:hypothetical protein
MFKNISDFFYTILDKLKLNIKDKEQLKYNLKKYNFIVIFGVSFCIYLIVFSIQSIFGKKTSSENDIVQANDQQVVIITDQTQQAEENSTSDNQVESSTQQTYTFTTVDESYLNGALFIGDSRTVALQMYGGLVNSNFFVNTGMNIWKVMESQIANVNGQNMTVDAALQVAKYDKIYIMLGINEVGTGTPDTFLQQYCVVINRIKQLQPQAVIYIQSIMHVTQSKDDANTSVSNVNINARNEKLKTLADNVSVFWLDENEVFDLAGTGKLNPEYTSDGVHLKAKYIQLWVKYLLSHAVVK